MFLEAIDPAHELTSGTKTETLALIEEKVLTAQAHLPMINELYKLIDAEYLVVAAEEQRAAILPYVIEAEQRLADVRRTMIPLQMDKANARLEQAEAITAEVEVKRQIEELGYRRIELKAAEEDAQHDIREAELTQNQANLEYIRADRAVQLARQQAETILKNYELFIKNQLIELRKALEMDEKGYRIDLQWFWKQWDLLHDVIALEFEKGLFDKELATKLGNLIDAARDDCRTVKDRAWKKHQTFAVRRSFEYITKG